MKGPVGSLTILGIALVHLYWGVVLVFSAAPMQTTPIATLGRHLHHTDLAGILISVAIAAVVAVLQEPGRLSLAMMMPQQMVLTSSALAGLRASILGQYADGTIVKGGWAHISTDQAPVIMLMLLHVAALLAFHGYLRRWLG